MSFRILCEGNMDTVNILSQFATCWIVYLSFRFSTNRPMSRFALSGAVFTVMSTYGPLGVFSVMMNNQFLRCPEGLAVRFQEFRSGTVNEK